MTDFFTHRVYNPGNEVEKHIEKLKDTDEELQEQNNILQTENDELRVIIKKLGGKYREWEHPEI